MGRRHLKRILKALWFAGMLATLSLYFRHLHADFPNYSPWTDWAKFTDEGWYGDGAIRHALFGRWDVPGDFNAAAALPVLPALEAALFQLGHVGLSEVRVLAVSCFVTSLLVLFLLVRRFQSGMTAGLVVTLSAVSPYNFAFMRLGILEPPLILFSLLLLLACSQAQWRRWSTTFAIGVLLALVVLTKTTGIVVAPAAIYLLWSVNHRNPGQFLRCLLVAGATTFMLLGGYGLLLVRTHHVLDFVYLFQANHQPNLTLHSRWDAFRGAVWDGHWIGSWIYCAACGVVALALLWRRRMLRNPLFVACSLWIASVLFFIGWHCNLQPRYYASVLPAALTVVCLQLEQAWRARSRWLTSVLLVVVAVVLTQSSRQTFRWATHPEYSYWSAANALASTIRNDPQQNRLLMSISGSDITLMTGVRSICDDFGTDELDDRIIRYKPGWYASWDDIDPETYVSLKRFYAVEKVGSWPAMDDPDRRVLELWRLVPRAIPGPPQP